MVLAPLKPPLEFKLQAAHGLEHHKCFTIPELQFHLLFAGTKTQNEIKQSDVSSSRGWCGRGNRCPGSSRLRAALPVRKASQDVWAANPHLECERLCGSGEDMLHGTEGQNILCESSLILVCGNC